MALQLQKQQIYLIAGIGLALASAFMIKVYLDQQKKAVQEAEALKYKEMQKNEVPVLVAKQDITRGKTVEPEDFTVSIIPNQFVQPGAVTSLDRIVGMVTIAPISRGEQVTITKLVYQRETGGGALAEVTPPGKRAITISVDNISSLAGMIKSGDRVDIIAVMPQNILNPEGKSVTQMVTLPIFQNILVLAVGQQTEPEPRSQARFRTADQQKQDYNPLITLALSPQEASLIAFIQEQGKIRLTLRSVNDTTIERPQAASWDALLNYVFPERMAKAPQEEYKPSDYVEIYRGLKKEKVLLQR